RRTEGGRDGRGGGALGRRRGCNRTAARFGGKGDGPRSRREGPRIAGAWVAAVRRRSAGIVLVSLVSSYIRSTKAICFMFVKGFLLAPGFYAAGDGEMSKKLEKGQGNRPRATGVPSARRGAVTIH